MPTPHVPPHAPTFARPAPVLESPAGVSSAATARSIHNWRDQPAAVAPGEPMSTWEPEEKGSPFGWIRRIPLWAVLSVILIGAVIALLASGLPGNLWRSWSTGSLRQEEQSSNESVPPAGEEPARATPSRAAAHPGSTNPHAALPPSESSARYGIQAASFKSEENARAALVGLQRATGLTGTVLPSGGSGTRWYRVVLGEFEHASAAVNKAQELSQKGVVPGDRVVVVLEPESAPPARR